MREVDVVLRDGSTVHVRPVRPEDEARYLAFLRALSEESRAMRYFVPTSETFLAEEARRETHVDHDQRVGLVATTGAEERIVGHAIFARRDGDRAEVAVAVADEYQGKGIGTILVGYLAEAAAARGVRVFEAEVMPANHRMVQLFRESGFPLEVNVKAGELHVRFPTLVTDEARAVFEQRERVASVNALHPFFQPPAPPPPPPPPAPPRGGARRRAPFWGGGGPSPRSTPCIPSSSRGPSPSSAPRGSAAPSAANSSTTCSVTGSTDRSIR